MAELHSNKSDRRITHGKSHTVEYRIWKNMIARCHRSTTNGFADYGGRGISVCDRWRCSFVDFLRDMGERPSPQHSIERKNVNGDYEKMNCVWATDKEQMRNRRDTEFVLFHGAYRKLVELCEEQGIKRSTARQRLRRGENVELAFEAPVKDNVKILLYRGVPETISVLCGRFQIYRNTVKQRISKGWTVEAALETPVAPRKTRKDKRR